MFAPNVALNQLSGTVDIEQGNPEPAEQTQPRRRSYGSTNSTGTTILALGNFNLNRTQAVRPRRMATSSKMAAPWSGNNVINGALNGWPERNGISTMTVLTNSTLTIAGGTGNNDLPNCILTNSGTLALGPVVIFEVAEITRRSSNLWPLDAGDHQQPPTQRISFGAAMFNNYGTFRKSGSSTN